MPNHCANSLKITATNQESTELLAAIRAELEKDEPSIFQTIDPCPEQLNDTVKGFPKNEDLEAGNVAKFGFPTWYEFKIQRWGTKWDAYEVETIRNDEKTLLINFDTAWSPPIGIYETLKNVGFDVEATYCEQGCGFVGCWINGKDITEHFPNYDDVESEADFLDDFFTAYGVDHSPAHFGG